ncbi:MAG: D-alanine--D-alanine ligase [Bacteroidetes bacterium]|nr:D-alanine--D-alanine ligase [Bacteroidota bacterium]
MRIGIIFGGFSKEREISFAGGRTVFDNLDKSLFDAVPVFVDSFGNFILLNWEFIYKGSIRDFYPPVEMVPDSPGEFQVYAESLNPGEKVIDEMITVLGEKILPSELKNNFDLAFLCLHGPFGEDGRIQGMFEYLGIPYTGSGVLPSAIGINKVIQKKLMVNAGFNSPQFFSVTKNEWTKDPHSCFARAEKEIGFPLVVKAANQGSSIGVSILREKNQESFANAVERSFFERHLAAAEWKTFSTQEKNDYVRVLADIREGIGMPVQMRTSGNSEIIHHPDVLLERIEKYFEKNDNVIHLVSLDGESEVLIEGFITGKEFSCIVVEDENGKPVALPPTEIRKGKELFDYRSKYLPGLSRKITPIELPDEQIEEIRKECERLFSSLDFDVYARIDGFISPEGKIFLNDPNTTSGMMPSSFFFHQAAEIGLDPSRFLTYIIHTSLRCRMKQEKNSGHAEEMLKQLNEAIDRSKEKQERKIKTAVLLGGYSSERHISVESGRNVYEKLSSSTKYAPLPVFLSGDNNDHELYTIPVNVLLKDNADDIREKIMSWKVHPVVKNIIRRCEWITKKFSSPGALAAPKKISYEELAAMADVVFIALHGRPGEDGAVQEKLDALGIPYNGSGKSSSEITIDKFRTNEILMQNGFLAAAHLLVGEKEWNENKNEVLRRIDEKIKWPFIAKPVDDGCSSAVRRIRNKEELAAFAELIFRKTEEFDASKAELLRVKPKEEFPRKKVFLVEELISKKDAAHFLEVTGGLITKYDDKGELEYEVFEASEALSEGEVLSLEEKFLAGQGQNITPARYDHDPVKRRKISDNVKATLGAAARLLHVQGYARIDAFVRVYADGKSEIIFVEVNSLPGMTPATCIFHQAAIQRYKPYDFIDRILDFAFARKQRQVKKTA